MAGRNVTARFSVEADVAQAKRDLEGITQQVDQLGKAKVDNVRQELEQLTASTGKLAGGYTALTQDQRQAYQQREQDAQSVERLRRSYKTLEGALEAVDVQVQHGHRSAEDAVRIQGLLAQAYGRTSVASQQSAQAIAAGVAATRAAVVAQESAAASTRRLNGVVQQAGWQVSDFANQMANGGNVATAAGMQLGQLLGSLGPLGAALGAVVNVGGVAVGIIQKHAAAAEEAKKAVSLLTAAQRAGLEITESATDKSRRLRDERNEQAAAAYRAAIAERELADALAVSAALRASQDLSTQQNMFPGIRTPGVVEAESTMKAASEAASRTGKALGEAQEAYEKFRSSLTQTGGYSTEEVDKLRERVDGIVSSYDDATLRTVTLRQKQEELGEAVKAGVITQAQAGDILQKYTKHLDENSKAAKEAAKAASEHEKAEAKLEKQIIAAVKAADAKAVEEYNKVMGEGKRVYESTRTPAEKYVDTLADLRRLLAAGAIDQDTFNRAAKAADPAFQEATKTLERYQQDVTRVATDIGKDISENLWDQITGEAKAGDALDFFKNWAKRLAVEMLNQNIVLPITMQLVGSMPSLFGIQAPGGSAANENGGLTGSLTNFGLSQGGSWAMDRLGITGGMSGLMNTPLWTGSSGIAPGFVDTIGATQITNTSAMTGGGATLGGVLGAAGAGAAGGGLVGGYLGTATNSKAVGGISGAVAGAGSAALASYLGFSALGGPVGLAIGAIAGAIMGMIGTQKATVGKTASADVTIASNGKSATYGNVLTDNEGDPAAGQALGTALSGIYSIAAMGGGTLTKDFGIGQTAANGLYVSGSVPYKEFGDDVAGLLRYTLLDQGGLKDGGANTIAALKNSTAKDWEEAAKDIGLGASIDAGNTALSEFDKSLNGITKSAKEATTTSLAPMFEELERAKKLGIDGAYVQLASDQLVSYLDTLRNPVAYTEVETAVASMKGQFQAMREAAEQLNPAIVSTIDAIEKETTARMAAEAQDDANRQLNVALGHDYINSINDMIKLRETNAKNLSAVGLSTQRSTEIFDASLKKLLEGLSADDLGVVADLFVGYDDAVSALARSMRSATVAAAQATQFESLFAQIRQDNISETISGLNDQINTAKSAQSSWENLLNTVSQARQNLLVGDLSTLDPKAKMDSALEAYRTALAAAQGGDVDAAGQVSSLAQTALQAARAYHASNEDYAAIFSEVTGGLEGVESVASRQVSLASSQLSTLNSQLAVQQDMLKALNQSSQTDVNSVLAGLNSGNLADLVQWGQRQGSKVLQQVLQTADQTLGWQNNPYRYTASADIASLNIPTNDWLGVLRSVGYTGSDDAYEVNAWIAAYGKKDQYESAMRAYAKQAGIPGYAVGTDSAPPGFAWVGEQGRELVQMAGGERVYPHSISQDIARSWNAANDRWAGVAEFRRPAASGGGNADMLTELRRQNRLLEEQNQLLRQGNSTAGMVGDRVVSRLDGVKDEVRGSAARAEFAKKKVA